MNLWLRLLWLRLRTPFRPRVGIEDVGRMPMRVWPSDLDVLGHVNNGVYLTMMDLGRTDLMLRSGAWKRMVDAGIYPVVASQTISYRKSLDPWVRFTLETRLVGADDRATYIEQRFVVDGEIYAQAHVRARFLRKSGGTVPIAEMLEVAGSDGLPAPAPWVAEWADDVALPPTKAPAPSVWDGEA